MGISDMTFGFSIEFEGYIVSQLSNIGICKCSIQEVMHKPCLNGLPGTCLQYKYRITMNSPTFCASVSYSLKAFVGEDGAFLSQLACDYTTVGPTQWVDSSSVLKNRNGSGLDPKRAPCAEQLDIWKCLRLLEQVDKRL